jgi:MFS family permease
MPADQRTVQATTTSPRAFWRYWAAMTTSNVGTAVTSVALPLTAVTVLEATAFEVSTITAAGYVAWIVLGLPAGVIVQRFPLRETQVAMDVARAVAIGSIPLAWWLDQLTFPHLVVAALVVSFASVLFDVGNATYLPSIVSKEELTSRNSFVSGTHATTSLGGPAIGGMLVQLLGAAPTLVVDAVSYVVSALFLRGLPRAARSEVSAPGTPPRMATLIGEGWGFVTRHPVMRPCMLAATSINLVNGALLALVPVFLVRVQGFSAGLVGLLIAVEGIGSLVSAAVTPRLVRRIGSARAIIVAGVAGGFFALLMPLGHGVVGMVAFGVGSAGFAAGVVVLSICTRTHRQVASPAELLSRVMATVRFVSWGAIPVGALAAGTAASWLGVHETMWLFCALSFGAPLVLWLSPVRALRDLGDT